MQVGRKMMAWLLTVGLLTACATAAAETNTPKSPLNMVVNRAESWDGLAMPEAARQRTDTIVLGAQSLSGIFTPFFAKTQGDLDVSTLLFDELLFADEYGEMGDGFAQMHCSEDGLVYTFTLARQATFSDGSPVGAADFINAMYLTLIPNYQGNFDLTRLGIAGLEAYLCGESAEITGIVQTKEYEFTVALTQANPSAPAYLAIPALSVAYYGDCKRPATITTAAERTAFERETLARIRALDSTPMGYGQYDLTEYVSGEKARFTANADYWRAQPSTGFFEIQVVPMGREVDAVLDGTVDIVRAYSTIKVVDSVYKSGFVSIYSWMGDVVGYLGMQASCPLFTDLRVRQALAMGIDRQQVVTNTLERYGTLPGMLLFDSFAETSDVLGEKYPLDRIRANALLDEAGWTRGTDGVRVKDGQRFAFTFVATKENPVTEAMAAGLQLCATQLGLEIKMEWVPFDELCRRVETGDCDMYFEARHLPTHPALAADLFVGESPLNHSGYTSEGMERFTNWAAREKDEARQSVIYEGMYQEMYLELPFIPIYRRADLLLVNGRVRNLYISSAHAITSDAYRFIIRDAKTDDE